MKLKTFGQIAFEKNNKNIVNWLKKFGTIGKTYTFIIKTKRGKTKVIKYKYNDLSC